MPSKASAKKGEKKGSQIPAVDPLDLPASPRRNDVFTPQVRVPQPPSPPSGVPSPTGSKSSQDFKIGEVSKGSATSELTSTSRDLQGSNNINATDIQLLEYADAAGLTRHQQNDCIDLLKERGSMSGVDTLNATPSQIRSLAQIVDSNRDTSLMKYFNSTCESSTTVPPASNKPGPLSASDQSKIESRIKQPDVKEYDNILKQAPGSSDSALSSNQKQALVAVLLRNTGQPPHTIPSLQPPASNTGRYRSIRSRAEPAPDARPGPSSLPHDLIAVPNTLTVVKSSPQSRSCTPWPSM